MEIEGDEGEHEEDEGGSWKDIILVSLVSRAYN